MKLTIHFLRPPLDGGDDRSVHGEIQSAESVSLRPKYLLRRSGSLFWLVSLHLGLDSRHLAIGSPSVIDSAWKAAVICDDRWHHASRFLFPIPDRWMPTSLKSKLEQETHPSRRVQDRTDTDQFPDGPIVGTVNQIQSS